MLIAIWALNHLTAYRLLTACRGVSLDSYRHQTTNYVEKFLDQESVKNTTMITVLIFLIFCMYIGPTRLLEDGAPNAKFDVDGKLRLRSTSLDWDDSAKIEEAITTNEDKIDEEKDSRKKNRQ